MPDSRPPIPGSRPVLEYATSTGSRIDRSARVIRGVKVLGFTSANTGRVLGLDPKQYGPALDRPYRYDPQAVRSATNLYEGIAVNIDHPATSAGPEGRRVAGSRSAADRFGRLTNVRVGDDGLVADLEYLASHPLAEMILETAERMPEQLALSHHARCEFGLENGQIVARRIVAVHSVDVISERPGTTRSLFESQSQTLENRLPPVSLQTLVERLPADSPAGKTLKQLLESKTAEPDLLIALCDEAPTEAAALSATARAILSPAFENDTADVLPALSRVRPVFEAWLALNADGRQAALEQENRRLHSREQARVLIESAGLRATDALVKAIAALESRADQDALLQTLSTSSRPRSSEPLPEPMLDRFEKPNGKAFAQLARA